MAAAGERHDVAGRTSGWLLATTICWSAAAQTGSGGSIGSSQQLAQRAGLMQSQEAELGVPFGNTATGLQTYEMVLEANYDVQVTRGVNVQPGFQ